MRRSMVVLAATVLVGAGALALPGGAQASPTLTATPARAGIGAGYQIRVTGCSARPTIEEHIQFSDVVVPSELPDDEGGGVWSYSAGRLGTADHFFTLAPPQCGLTAALTARIDVDNPQIVTTPVLGDEPTGVAGTDCPDGVDATVVVRTAAGDTSSSVQPTDEFGDWAFALPAEVPGGGEVVVEASCGSVAYEAVTYLADAAPTPPPAAPPAPPPAAPAAPVVGPARLTG